MAGEAGGGLRTELNRSDSEKLSPILKSSYFLLKMTERDCRNIRQQMI